MHTPQTRLYPAGGLLADSSDSEGENDDDDNDEFVFVNKSTTQELLQQENDKARTTSKHV
jgi:hypothetical protein